VPFNGIEAYVLTYLNKKQEKEKEKDVFKRFGQIDKIIYQWPLEYLEKIIKQEPKLKQQKQVLDKIFMQKWYFALI
jgi:hypothetical protein